MSCLPFVLFALNFQVSFIDFFPESLFVPNPPDSFLLDSCPLDGLTLDTLLFFALPSDFLFASTLLGVLDLADADLFFMQFLDAFFVL